MLIFALILVLVLLIVGFPIFMAMGIPSILMGIGLIGGPPQYIAQLMVGFTSKYLFMSIPLFILAGEIMAKGGATKRLVELVESLIGHVPGGLALVVVYSCAVLSTLTGSTMAIVAAIAPVMYKPMIERGYSVPFTSALIAVAGTLGILYPPSIPMILYSGITEEPIITLFMAGFLPGIALTLLLTALILIMSRRAKFGRGRRFSWSERRHLFVKSMPVLLLPVIILGGIFSGIFTATEAAAIAAIWSFLISKFWYKDLSWKNTYECITHAAVVAGMVMLLAGFAQLLANSLINLKVTNSIVDWVVANFRTPALFLLAINVMYIIVGCFIDPVSMLLLSVPVLYPVLAPLGISGIHFCIIFVLNDEIGLITPPVGLNLFVLSGVTKVPIETIVRGILPFFIVLVIMLFIVTYWPTLSLILPQVLGMPGVNP